LYGFPTQVTGVVRPDIPSGELGRIMQRRQELWKYIKGNILEAQNRTRKYVELLIPRGNKGNLMKVTWFTLESIPIGIHHLICIGP
jgi:uncharacterized protein (DUF3820 family)